jgi:hypothetical protein
LNEDETAVQALGKEMMTTAAGLRVLLEMDIE